ncbi:MAG: site-2 protease family protein, partial [Planctomycetota bacterium]
MFLFALSAESILPLELIAVLSDSLMLGQSNETSVNETSTLVSWFMSTWLWVKVALGIGLVVFVHELGHFLAAKTFGVKCEKFYVGFDVPIQIGPIKFPRTLGKFTYGETEYGIGILPLGGYVKMLGQDDDPRKAEAEAERIRVGETDEATDEVKLDPRSYPAKPVWQRMIIISAGVVMNVITGVLFAAIAYFSGVSYTPAAVGSASIGGPAWSAGIQPGGRIISVADSEDNDQLHFSEMMMGIMTAGLEDADAPINVRVAYDSTEETLTEYRLQTQSNPVQPERQMIGIRAPQSNRLPKQYYAMPGSVAADVLSDQDAGGSVTAIDGTPVDPSAVNPLEQLHGLIQTKTNDPVTFTLVRRDDSKTEITLPPQPALDFGVRFGVGPISAIAKGSPAEEAGLQIGDVIESIDGNDNLDAYTIILDPPAPGQSIDMTVRRGRGDSATTEQLTLRVADRLQVNQPVSSLTGAIGSDLLGIAFLPSSEVVAIDQTSELQIGDEIRELRFVFRDAKAKESLLETVPEDTIAALVQGWEINPAMTLVTLMDTIQVLPIDTEVKVKALRPPNGQVVEATLKIAKSERNWFDRGLNFTELSETHYAGSLGAAVALGIREGKNKLAAVGQFLGLLVRGRVNAKYVGGPVRIVQLAGYEAERGISAQLLFLTMLSMNLAILNFLPIPALDGGHMVFLTAELIRGRRVDEALEMRLTLAGVLCLLALMVFVFANDIWNIV